MNKIFGFITVKSSILVIVLGLLVSSIIQIIFQPFHPGKLEGVFDRKPMPEWALKTWFSGKYQDSLRFFAEDSSGFRNDMVRLYNQVDYSLFSISHTAGGIVGKDGSLITDKYVNSYLGMDYIGRKKIENNLNELLALNRELEKRNIRFILIFAPGKARFRPENIPDFYLKSKRKNSNYQIYTELLASNYKEIHFIDFSKYFDLLKDTIRYPLYPRGGIHWSNYATQAIVFDSLINYMRVISGRNLPEIKVDTLEFSDKLRIPDNDLAKSMNLIIPYRTEKMPYPVLSTSCPGDCWHPNVLGIADSYYWEFLYIKVINEVFKRNDFWFYNKEKYPYSIYHGKEYDPEFLKQDLLKHDFVILLTTEINLPHLFFFAENVLLMLDPNNTELLAKKKVYEARIRYYIGVIRSSKGWMDLVRQKAVKLNIPFEEMIKRDAEYMVQVEQGKEGQKKN